jgi:hypothetical protein
MSSKRSSSELIAIIRNDIKRKLSSAAALCINPALFGSIDNASLDSIPALSRYSSGKHNPADIITLSKKYLFILLMIIDKITTAVQSSRMFPPNIIGLSKKPVGSITNTKLTAKNPPEMAEPARSVFVILYRKGSNAKRYNIQDPE